MKKFESNRIRVKSRLPPVSGIKILMPTVEEMPVQTTLDCEDDNESQEPIINTSNKYPCKFCDKSFLRNDHLKRHIRNLHTITNCYLCPVCDINCDTYKSFCGHLNGNHQSFSNFTCKNCDFECESVSEYISHFEDHLVAENYLHKCPVCDAPFKRADHVKRHIKNIHKRQVSCPKCSEVFSSKPLMVKHLKTHGQEPKIKKKKVVMAAEDGDNASS